MSSWARSGSWLPVFGAALAATAVSGLVSWIGGAHADGAPTSEALRFSGTITEGGIRITATRAIDVLLWDSDSGGTELCRTTRTVDVVDGRFSTELSSNCADAVHTNRDAWVELRVSGTGYGRQRVGAVPYALEATRASNGAPPGAIVPFAGETVPAGWLACDGTVLPIAGYEELHAAIGTAWCTSPPPAGSFCLPDLRGQFLRGAHGPTAIDPDGATRDVGTLQGDALRSHSHGVSDPGHEHASYWGTAGCVGAAQFARGDWNSCWNTYPTTRATTGISIGAFGGAETRPVNAAVSHIIKI